jgi:hypothetical protein
MSQWLATLLVIVLTAVGSPPVSPRGRRLWMASILGCGCFAIAGMVWQGQKEGHEAKALAGTTLSPEAALVDRNRRNATDLAKQLKALQGRVKELEAVSEARTITPNVADQLATYLKQFGSHRVIVSCIPDDGEAYQYANQLLNILKAANWDAQGPQITKIFGDVRARGINLYVSGDNHSDSIKIIFDGLTKFNIPYQSRVTPSGAIPDSETVELFIGTQHSAEANDRAN